MYGVNYRSIFVLLQVAIYPVFPTTSIRDCPFSLPHSRHIVQDELPTDVWVYF